MCLTEKEKQEVVEEVSVCWRHRHHLSFIDCFPKKLHNVVSTGRRRLTRRISNEYIRITIMRKSNHNDQYNETTFTSSGFDGSNDANDDDGDDDNDNDVYSIGVR